MSSAAQLEANRRNAQHCTGPRTEAGKEASKYNAFRHGLASTQVVLPHEDRAAFEDLKASLIEEHRPATPTEQLLVAQLAETWWRSLRAHRVESEYLNHVVTPPPQQPDAVLARGPQRIRRTGDAALADAVVSDRDNDFAKIQRYVTAAGRAFRNALNELRKAQQAREKAAEQARRNEELERVRDVFRASRNGFVPQSAPKTAPPSPPPTSSTPLADRCDGFWLKNPPLNPADSILNTSPIANLTRSNCRDRS